MDMIHIRMVSPPAQTPQVVARLSGDEYVAHLVVLPGSAHNPPGDLIECDVFAGAANALLHDLRALEVHSGGAVMIDPVDLAMSGRLDQVGQARLGPLAQAPLWTRVEARIHADATYAPSFYLYLIIAGIIGAVGLLTNSEILIVAAMILGPEYAAISAVALGMDRGRRARITGGLWALTVGFTLAVVASWAFTLLVRLIDRVPEAYERGIRPVVHLIDTPNIYSVVVAVLAGIAGIVALTHARSSTLLGVFVSVTTIPAAAAVGVGLATGSPGDAGTSFLQLLLNVVILIVVGFLSLRAQRALWGRVGRRWARRHPDEAPGAISPSPPSS
ncbi:MAG: DUF389 domain-containing protein [Hamadaea sp.]|nr:DUF389 domain-containing protein [Hamadaea sp.]